MKNTIGKVSKEHDGFQVRFERKFSFDIETVWQAITNPEKLAIWFTDIKMDFREGGDLTIQFRDTEKTLSHGKILRIKKPTLFEYIWEGELATWELSPEGKNACKLIFTYSKFNDEYALHVPAGWHVLLDQLESVLNGKTEPYPFGQNTPESEEMKTFYTELISKEFPYLKSKS